MALRESIFCKRFCTICTDTGENWHSRRRSCEGSLLQRVSVSAVWTRSTGRLGSLTRCLAGVHPQDDVLPLIRNLKLTLLSHRWSLQLYTTIRRCHQQSAPALLLEKLSFHEHQHSTRGRQQGDFRPFQPASLAGRISFTNRAPLLWNMLPREVQTSSSMLVFKKNVLSLLDSPSSGKTSPAIQVKMSLPE